jgi:Family of unknown function (DUF6448)
MKTLRINDRRLLAAATVIVLVALERAAAWIMGSQGWLGELGGGVALLAFGLGHCDGLDGPVVSLARRALNDSNVNLVLPWVREQDEAEIREAFTHAVAVRKLGGEARALADQHFFETLVRVHRAGEGAPYTGLKPAGRDLGPAIPAADRALEDGSVDKLLKVLGDAVRKGLHEHFHPAVASKSFAPDDVRAGRKYVEAYVPYIHYVERLWQAASGPAHGHHAAEEPHAH